MSKQAAIEKLELAKEKMAEAARALENTMSDIAVAPRAEKVSVSGAVESALSNLAAAKAAVDDLEKLLRKVPD
jgi:hypothetical protein